MANKINKPISVQNTRMILTRGYDTEKAKKTLVDGEVYFDMNGKTILMGVYQGANKPVKIVEMAVGGSGEGSLTPEQLADLVKKGDIKEIVVGGSYTDTDVASAQSVATLAADLFQTSQQSQENSQKIALLEKTFMENGISPEVQAYLNALIADAKLESSPTILVQPVIDKETSTIIRTEVAVNTDTQSLDKVADETGKERLGLVWAQLDDDNTSSDSSDDDDDEFVGEGFGDDDNLTANILG